VLIAPPPLSVLSVWSGVGTLIRRPKGRSTSTTSKVRQRMSWRAPESMRPMVIFPGGSRLVTQPSVASIASSNKVER
jgi:hypothetical protein